MDYRDEFVVEVETTLLVMGQGLSGCSSDVESLLKVGRSDCPLRKALNRTWA